MTSVALRVPERSEPRATETRAHADVRYANGSLFAEPSCIDLTPQPPALLREVSAPNWHEVQPSIFGSLLQGVFGHEKQWRLGRIHP